MDKSKENNFHPPKEHEGHYQELEALHGPKVAQRKIKALDNLQFNGPAPQDAPQEAPPETEREIKYRKAAQEALTGSDILKKAKEQGPIQYLIDGLLTDTGLSILYAPAKAGKTLIANQMASAIARGTDLNRWQRNQYGKPLRTLYVDTEMEPADYTARFGEAYLASLPFAVHSKEFILEHELNLYGNLDNLCQYLDTMIQAGYRFILLDNLNALITRPSDPEAAQETANRLSQILISNRKQGRKASILLINHTTTQHSNKDGYITAQQMKGAQSWEAVVRNLIAVGKRQDLPEGEKGFYLKSVMARGKEPDNMIGKVLPYTLEETSEGHVQLTPEPPKYESQCITNAMEYEGQPKMETQAITLGLLDGSNCGSNRQTLVANWTDDSQSHVSRAKSRRSQAYNEAKLAAEAVDTNPEAVISIWDRANAQLSWESLPPDFNRFLNEARQKIDQNNIPF